MGGGVFFYMFKIDLTYKKQTAFDFFLEKTAELCILTLTENRTQ